VEATRLPYVGRAEALLEGKGRAMRPGRINWAKPRPWASGTSGPESGRLNDQAVVMVRMIGSAPMSTRAYWRYTLLGRGTGDFAGQGASERTSVCGTPSQAQLGHAAPQGRRRQPQDLRRPSLAADLPPGVAQHLPDV
jgi:hypothetical protein